MNDLRVSDESELERIRQGYPVGVGEEILYEASPISDADVAEVQELFGGE